MRFSFFEPRHSFWNMSRLPIASQVIFGMVGLFASCFRFPLTPVVIVPWMLLLILGASMVFVEVELGTSSDAISKTESKIRLRAESPQKPIQCEFCE